MAAITCRVRPPCLDIHHSLRLLACQCFSSSSSSSSSDPIFSQSEPQSHLSVSFNFNEVKASLQEEQRTNRHQIARRPLLFPNSKLARTWPSKIESLEEIRHNLAEFRLRSAAPPPSASSGQFISLQELYKRNVISTPGDSATGSEFSFDSIRENLRQLRGTTPAARNRNESIGKIIDPMSLDKFKESLKVKASENLGNESMSSADSAAMRTKFVKVYDYTELGKKLGILRPEKKGMWFSIQELSERLAMLREMDEKEDKEKVIGGLSFTNLSEILSNLNFSDDEKARKKTMQRLNILSHVRGTPSQMLLPPKEQLVEKYFHPDHMSAAEKLKLELKKVRDEFKMSESDCGSARVQVAELTTKIKYLSSALQEKDKHSRKGLQAMVQRRKKMLKYLRRTDWDSYTMVISKLGLRDNPNVIKA